MGHELGFTKGGCMWHCAYEEWSVGLEEVEFGMLLVDFQSPGG